MIGALLLAVAASGTAQEARAPSIAVEDITPGAKGYGLSVFSGISPQRFDVEVLGVVRNLHPDTSFILARLSGQGLERSGVIAGMSGSPVFVGDRLAGAVAFSWSFANEPIAGITPIDAMRELGGLPTPGSVTPRAAVELAQLISGALPEQLLEERLRLLAPRLPSGASAPLQWASVGFGNAVRGRLEEALGPVAPAGSSPEIESDLVPGSSVAGVLIGGDLQLTFTGTVTERRDEEILAFGHSYLGLGPIRMPMASAEVVTVVPSRASSFKLANVGPVVGSFEEDRLAGLRGRVGKMAPTIPVDIRIAGEPEKAYHLELAEIPLTTPTLAAVALLEAMDAARHQSGLQDLLLKSSIALADHAPLVLERHFAGNSAVLDSALYLLSLMSFILHNESQEVEIQGIDLQVDQAPEPRTVTLVGAHADRRNVRPGDEITVHLELRHYRGDTVRRSARISLPDDLPEGPYYLFVGDGGSIGAARLQIEPSEPKDFEQALKTLRSFHGPRDLVTLGVLPAGGLLVDGTTLPQLPASVRSLWAASGPLAAKPVALAIREQTVERLDFPFSGAARIDLTVLASRH